MCAAYARGISKEHVLPSIDPRKFITPHLLYARGVQHTPCGLNFIARPYYSKIYIAIILTLSGRKVLRHQSILSSFQNGVGSGNRYHQVLRVGSNLVATHTTHFVLS